MVHGGGAEALGFDNGPLGKAVNLWSRKMASTPKPKEGKRWRTKSANTAAKKPEKGLLSRLKISASDITVSPTEETKAKPGGLLDENLTKACNSLAKVKQNACGSLPVTCVPTIVDLTQDGTGNSCASSVCGPSKPPAVRKRGCKTKWPVTKTQVVGEGWTESYSGKTNECSKTGLIVVNVEPLTLNQTNTPGLFSKQVLSNHGNQISPPAFQRRKQKISANKGSNKKVTVEEVPRNSDVSAVCDINKTIATDSGDPLKRRSLDICTLPMPKAVEEHGETGEDDKCADFPSARPHAHCDRGNPAVPQCPNKSISLILDPNEGCPAPDRTSPEQSNETGKNMAVLPCVSNKLNAKANWKQTSSAGLSTALKKDSTVDKQPRLCVPKRQKKCLTKSNKSCVAEENPVKSPCSRGNVSGSMDKSAPNHNNFIFAKSFDGDLSDSLVSTIDDFESCLSEVDDCTILDSGDRVNISLTYALKNFEKEKLPVQYPSCVDKGDTLCFGGESSEAAKACISDQELEKILEGIIAQVEGQLASPKSTTASLGEGEKCMSSIDNSPNRSSLSKHVVIPNHSHHDKEPQYLLSGHRSTCFPPNRKRKMCEMSGGVKEEEVTELPCKRLKLDYMCIGLEEDSDITLIAPSPVTGRTTAATGLPFPSVDHCDISFSTPEHDLDQDEIKTSGDPSDKTAATAKSVTDLPNSCVTDLPNTHVTVLPITCPSYKDLYKDHGQTATEQLKSQGYKNIDTCSENSLGDRLWCENNNVAQDRAGRCSKETKDAGKKRFVEGKYAGEMFAEVSHTGKIQSVKMPGSRRKKSPETLQSQCCAVEKSSPQTSRCQIYQRKPRMTLSETSNEIDVSNNFSKTSDSSHINSDEVVMDRVCFQCVEGSVSQASGSKTKKNKAKKLKAKKSQRGINESLDVANDAEAAGCTSDSVSPAITLASCDASAGASASASDTGSPKGVSVSQSKLDSKLEEDQKGTLSSQKRKVIRPRKRRAKEIAKKLSPAEEILTEGTNPPCPQQMGGIYAPPLAVLNPNVSPRLCMSEEVEDVFSPGGAGEVQVSETIRREAGINLKACVVLDRVPVKKKFKIGSLILVRKGRERNFYWRIKSKKVKSPNLSGKTDESCAVDTKGPKYEHDCVLDLKSSSDGEGIVLKNALSGEHCSSVSETDLQAVSGQSEAGQHVLNPMPERLLSPGIETPENKFSNSAIAIMNTICDFEIDKGQKKSPRKKLNVCKFPRKKSPKKTTPKRTPKENPKKNPEILTDFELAISKPVSDGKRKKSKEAAKLLRRKSSEESNPGDSCVKVKRNADIGESSPVVVGETLRFSGQVKSKIAQNILRKKAEDELEKSKPQQFEVDNPVSFLEILHGNPVKGKNDFSAKYDSVDDSTGGEITPTSNLTKSEGGTVATSKMVAVVNMVPDFPLRSSPLPLEIDLDCDYSKQAEEIPFSNFMNPKNVFHSKQTKLLPKLTNSGSSVLNKQSAVPDRFVEKPVASSTPSPRMLTFGVAQGSKQSVNIRRGEVLRKTVSKEKVLQAFEDVLEEMDFSPVYDLDSDEESVPSTMGRLSTCSSPETSGPLLPDPATISFGCSQPSRSCKPPIFGVKDSSQNPSQRPVFGFTVSSSNASAYVAFEEDTWDMGSEKSAKADTCDQPCVLQNSYSMKLNETEKGRPQGDDTSNEHEDGQIIDSDSENSLEAPNEESMNVNRTYVTVDEADCGTSFLGATLDETGECEPRGRMYFGLADVTVADESGLVDKGTVDNFNGLEDFGGCENAEKSDDGLGMSPKGSAETAGMSPKGSDDVVVMSPKGTTDVGVMSPRGSSPVHDIQAAVEVDQMVEDGMTTEVHSQQAGLTPSAKGMVSVLSILLQH